MFLQYSVELGNHVFDLLLLLLSTVNFPFLPIIFKRPVRDWLVRNVISRFSVAADYGRSPRNDLCILRATVAASCTALKCLKCSEFISKCINAFSMNVFAVHRRHLVCYLFFGDFIIAATIAVYGLM